MTIYVNARTGRVIPTAPPAHGSVLEVLIANLESAEVSDPDDRRTVLASVRRQDAALPAACPHYRTPTSRA